MANPTAAHKCPHCAGNLAKNDGLCARHFTKLQNQWYRVAKATGFEDAEKNGELIAHSSSYDREAKRCSVTARGLQDYYRMAGWFLYDYSFKDGTELDVWKMHSEGVSVREITGKMLAKDP